MKALIIIGIVLFLALSIWYYKRTEGGIDSLHESKVLVVSDTIDNPIDFGYKMAWIAVSTDQKYRLAEIMDLRNTKNANWESGIERAYSDGLFITPQIGKWTLIAGNGILNKGDNKDNIIELENLLNDLSAEFGEAQFFGTHRVVEFHCWMKSENGQMERVYSYIGESMENIKVYGNPTQIESELTLFNSFSKEAENENYYERDDLDFADEIMVMDIAGNWSVNPTEISERTDVKNELGLVGK